MASSVTLREVAERAGVSIGTASQALNNRPNVSPETRTRVMDAALALGYQMKEALASAAEPCLSIVGMLTKSDVGLPISANPFYAYVQAGVESECRHRNIGLMYATLVVDSQNRPVAWPAMINEQRVGGLLLIGAFIADTVDLVKKRAGLPIVLVDSDAPDLSFDSVVVDNWHGSISAVEYLIEQGHTCIGLVGSTPDSLPGMMERRQGYLCALREHGIRESFIQESRLDTDSGCEAARLLMQTHPEVTAIFACNDDVAIGVLRAARELGLDVPGNLSVVGFDNIDMAKTVTPALTTVHVHKIWLGTMGVRHLLDRAQDPDRPKITTRVSTQLVIRDTVRTLKK